MNLEFEHDLIYYLHGGPTGYESFYAREKTLEEMRKGDWCACTGTKGRWDELYFSKEVMVEAFEEFGELMRQFEEKLGGV